MKRFISSVSGRFIKAAEAFKNPRETVEMTTRIDFSILDCLNEDALGVVLEGLKASKRFHPSKKKYIAEIEKRLDRARG